MLGGGFHQRSFDLVAAGLTMNVSRIWCLCVAFCLAMVYAETLKASWPIKPYRALLVVERWSDPASFVVDHEKDDFQPVAALLKAWSIPFEIFRLDQQHLDDSYLFDREGKIRYGVAEIGRAHV